MHSESTITIGTCHYVSLRAARRAYGVDAAYAALTEGSIHVGAPRLKPGQRLHADATGRYFITELAKPRAGIPPTAIA